MASLLISGPAGAGKTAAARTERGRRAEPTVLVEFQEIYAALLGLQRLPNGRYPEREPADEFVLPLTEYTRTVILNAARARDIDVVVTNSDGDHARRAEMLGLLGPGARERVIDPGIAVVRQRLADPQTGLSPQCSSAISRWFDRV